VSACFEIYRKDVPMNIREKFNRTLNFEKMENGGAVNETFFPWTLTVDRWAAEGLPVCMTSAWMYPPAPDRTHAICNDLMTKQVYQYENYFGFDGIIRLFFNMPWFRFSDGQPLVRTAEDWEKLKQLVADELETCCTDEAIRSIYGKYAEGHNRGDYSIRFEIRGFFWTPRDLFGIEEHLMAFYEEPELMHDMNRFLLDVYLKYLDKIFDHIQPDDLYISEDLSGANGPMISPAMFDEFVGDYYRQLIPFLKKKGVKNVLVDTDGDFKLLIPNFLSAGVEGFIPLDVNAGMDIVELRKEYPDLKLVGGFNKLCIAAGKEAIDREFERLLPVIRQGGYIPGCDHQVAPSTSLENYKYYIEKLKEAMKQSGTK